MLIVEWERYYWKEGSNYKTWHYQKLKTFNNIQEVLEWLKTDIYNIKPTRIFNGTNNLSDVKALNEFYKKNNPLIR